MAFQSDKSDTTEFPPTHKEMSNCNHVTVEGALEVKTVGVVVSNHVVAVNWGVVQERVGTEEDVLRCPHKFKPTRFSKRFFLDLDHWFDYQRSSCGAESIYLTSPPVNYLRTV